MNVFFKILLKSNFFKSVQNFPKDSSLEICLGRRHVMSFFLYALLYTVNLHYVGLKHLYCLVL